MIAILVEMGDGVRGYVVQIDVDVAGTQDEFQTLVAALDIAFHFPLT